MMGFLVAPIPVIAGLSSRLLLENCSGFGVFTAFAQAVGLFMVISMLKDDLKNKL